MSYVVFDEQNRKPIKAWIKDVPVEQSALQQLRNVASLPVVGPHVAVMPDVHYGIGATVGSVIPTKRAIIPAAVGVDIGCGMMAMQVTLEPNDLDNKLPEIRAAIEDTVPIGGPGIKGSWEHSVPNVVASVWLNEFLFDYNTLVTKHPLIAGRKSLTVEQLGTLGTGNHFIEICVDSEEKNVWIMLHSGSRGVGNRIGTYFIQHAREKALKSNIHLPDRDLAWLSEGDKDFQDYVEAVGWAQRFARWNREIMMGYVRGAISHVLDKSVMSKNVVVNCHHNYVQKENHFGEDLYVTRKGAVSAGEGEWGIIPGSMGARSFIVRGKGNPESFMSCSHGAGRVMSRGEAKRRFTVEDHIATTKGVECRKDIGVIDETPAAYKPIDLVMAAQEDLVEVVYELRQVVCVKG